MSIPLQQAQWLIFAEKHLEQLEHPITYLQRSSLMDCIWCSTYRRELSKLVRESFWASANFVELLGRRSLAYILCSVVVFGQAQDLLSCRELQCRLPTPTFDRRHEDFIPSQSLPSPYLPPTFDRRYEDFFPSQSLPSPLEF